MPKKLAEFAAVYFVFETKKEAQDYINSKSADQRKWFEIFEG
jgi:hypothetical protein